MSYGELLTSSDSMVDGFLSEVQIANEGVRSQKRKQKKIVENASDIMIVYAEQLPRLHGILKRQNSRTVSELSLDDDSELCSSLERHLSLASGENSTSPEIDSPNDFDAIFYDKERDEEENETESASLSGTSVPVDICRDAETPLRRRKKTVSFSEHIDHTVYKSNQSVSTMHNTLKNRKKKVRKKEQRQQAKEEQKQRGTGRVRSASESSSSEARRNEDNAENELYIRSNSSDDIRDEVFDLDDGHEILESCRSNTVDLVKKNESSEGKQIVFDSNTTDWVMPKFCDKAAKFNSSELKSKAKSVVEMPAERKNVKKSKRKQRRLSPPPANRTTDAGVSQGGGYCSTDEALS